MMRLTLIQVLLFGMVLSYGCGTNEPNSSTALDLDGAPNETGSDTLPNGEADENGVMPMGNEPTEVEEMPADVPELNGNGVPSDVLDRAFLFLMGKFDSSAQAQEDPTYYNVQLHACEVEAPELGDRVLYIEQAMVTAVNQPYRQRLYVVTDNGDGRVASTVYTIANEDSYVGLCNRTERATFVASQVTERVGCTVYLSPANDGFTGGTEGTNCLSTLRGASYATSQVSLFSNRILSWDQGFNASGVQVWGAVRGAYEFIRTEDVNGAPVELPEEEIEPNGETETGATDVSQPANGIENFGGETCEDAPALAEVSTDIPADERGDVYRFRVESGFGRSNDYNPLRGNREDMAPNCALVYDAVGRETVFSVYLQPGDTISLKLTVEPRNFVGGLYMLDGCESPSWPDLDGSGACGNNEYASHGSCFYSRCDSLEWTYSWPIVVNGQETEGKRLYLVVDEVAADRAERFILDWAIN